MLNPSTATAELDDPTIRRCIYFAKRDGFGGLIVVNLYAYRATNPGELWNVSLGMAAGPLNASQVFVALEECDRAIAAWGALYPPPREIGRILRDHRRNIEALGVTQHGWPRHPLYLPKTAQSSPYTLPSSYLAELDSK